MRRREAFLREAIQIHRAYEQTSNMLRQLSRENKAYTPEWNEAMARQQQLLADWSALPLKYGDFDSEGQV